MWPAGVRWLVAQFPAPLGRGCAPDPPPARNRLAAGRWGLIAQFLAPLRVRSRPGTLVAHGGDGASKIA